MRYEGDIYRPPGEWKSYLLQVTVGCSHNAGTFCGMYKDKKYRERDLDEVFEDIEMAYRYYNGYLTRIFLCDGDAINLPTDYLLKLLKRLYDRFPMLEKVTTYAGPQSTLRKTPEELKAIREAGLQRAYLGIESGDGELLIKRGKGVRDDKMLAAGLALKNAGFDLWGIALVGLAGADPEASRRHAEKTAEIVTNMQPQHMSLLTYLPEPGTIMYDQIKRGEIEVLDAMGCLREVRTIVAGIETDRMHFTSNHASNYVPLKGTLPDDREKFLKMLDDAISGESKIRKEQFRRF